MMTGSVNACREPVLRLTVRGPAGQEPEVEAVIDTGFNGSMSLPSTLIAMLGLAWRRRGRALLADGSESVFDIYEATVMSDGQPRRVAIDGIFASPSYRDVENVRPIRTNSTARAPSAAILPEVSGMPTTRACPNSPANQ